MWPGVPKRASADLAVVTGGQKQNWLRCCARLLNERRGDACRGERRRTLPLRLTMGFPMPPIDRLRLTPPRIADMAAALEQVALLPEPIGEVISSSIRPNGLEVQKVRVSMGVILFIYESRSECRRPMPPRYASRPATP